MQGPDDVRSRTMDDIDSDDIERILSRPRYGVLHRKPLYQAPEFLKRLSAFEEARAGESVSFECRWSGCPPPAIKWYHDDEEVTDGRRRLVALPGGVLRLTIDDVCKADEGAYKCKAENQEGVASTTGYMSVKDTSRKSLSKQRREKQQKEPRRTHQRSVSNPPNLRSIVEQKSLEEHEGDACARQKPSPIQDFIDNLVDFRKENTWPLAMICRLDSGGSSGEDDRDSLDSDDSATGGSGAHRHHNEFDSVSFAATPHVTSPVTSPAESPVTSTPAHIASPQQSEATTEVRCGRLAANVNNMDVRTDRQAAPRPRSLLLRVCHEDDVETTNNNNDGLNESADDDDDDNEVDNDDDDDNGFVTDYDKSETSLGAVTEDRGVDQPAYDVTPTTVSTQRVASDFTTSAASPACDVTPPACDVTLPAAAPACDVTPPAAAAPACDVTPPTPAAAARRSLRTEAAEAAAALRGHLADADSAWLFYALFAAVATFVACQYAIEPRKYVLFVAIVALVSFRFLLWPATRRLRRASEPADVDPVASTTV